MIETTRLTLRELTIDDADFVLRLVNEPSFLSNIGDKGIQDLDDAQRFIREGSWTCTKKAGYGQFLVEIKQTREAAGVCGLLFRDSLDLSDVGCAFFPKFWGRGIAFEAATAVIEYGRSKLGVQKIVGLTSPDNQPSIALLEKLGMRFEKMVKMSDDDPGTALYSEM